MNDILQQILDEMKQMNQRIERLENGITTNTTEIQGMKSDMRTVNADIFSMKTDISIRFDKLEAKVSVLQTDVNEIKSIAQRIEESQPEDVHAMLQTINSKLDQRDADIQVLNKRVFQVESAIEKITRA